MVNLAPHYWQRVLGDRKYPNDMISFMDELNDRAQSFINPQIIEIGVNTGQSTIAFLFGLEGRDGKLWSCDIEMPKPPIIQFLGHPQWDFVLGCSTDEIVHSDAPECDILLIDGAYTNRLNDLVIYGAKMKPNGYIYVHDIDRRLVREEFETYIEDTGYNYDILRGNKNSMGVILCP